MLWNNLPQEVKGASTSGQFNRKLLGVSNPTRQLCKQYYAAFFPENHI